MVFNIVLSPMFKSLFRKITASPQEILGVPHASGQRYDAEFFKKFRSQNIVLSARTYARVISCL